MHHQQDAALCVSRFHARGRVLGRPVRRVRVAQGRDLESQVRRAVDTVGDFGVDRLRADQLPRALLVATDSAPTAVSRLVTRLSCTRTPAITWLARRIGAGVPLRVQER